MRTCVLACCLIACGDGATTPSVGVPLVAIAEGEEQSLIASGVVELAGTHPEWADFADGMLILEPDCGVVDGPRPPQLHTLQLRGVDETTSLQVLVERSITGKCGLEFEAYPCGTSAGTPLPRAPTAAFELCVVLNTRDVEEKRWVRVTSDLPKTKLRKLPAPRDGVDRFVDSPGDLELRIPVDAAAHVIGAFRMDFEVFSEDPRIATDPVADVRTIRFLFAGTERADVELIDDIGKPLAAFPPVAEYANVTARARAWLITPDGPPARCVRVAQLDADATEPPAGRFKSPVRVTMGGVAFQGGVLCSDTTPELSVSVSPGAKAQRAGATLPARLRFDICATAPGTTCDPSSAIGAETVDVPLVVTNSVDDIEVDQVSESVACAVDGSAMVVAATNDTSIVAAEGWPVGGKSVVDITPLEVLTSMVIAEPAEDRARVVALRQGALARLERIGGNWSWTPLVAAPASSTAVAGIKATAGRGVTRVAFLALDTSNVPFVRIACVAGSCTPTDVPLPGAAPNSVSKLGDLVAFDTSLDTVDDTLVIAVNEPGGVRTWRLALPLSGPAVSVPPDEPLAGNLVQLVYVADPIASQTARLVALVSTQNAGGALYDVSYVLPTSAQTMAQFFPFPPATALDVVRRPGLRDRLAITTAFGIDEVSIGPSTIRPLDPTRAELATGQQPLGGRYGDGLAACATTGASAGGPRLAFVASDGSPTTGPARYRVIDADTVVGGPWPDQGLP